MNKIGKSLKMINWKLFVSLLVMGLCPSIYSTVRVFFLGQLPGDWSFSIAGQLSWVKYAWLAVSFSALNISSYSLLACQVLC